MRHLVGPRMRREELDEGFGVVRLQGLVDLLPLEENRWEISSRALKGIDVGGEAHGVAAGRTTGFGFCTESPYT